MRTSGAAAAAAAVVTFIGLVGPRSVAEASLRKGFLRVEPGSQVSESDIDGHRALTDKFLSVCMNGYLGIQTGFVCCSDQCGECGGVGCRDRPGGGDSCCMSNILENGRSCNEVDAAPCFMEHGEPMPNSTSTSTVLSTCYNGLLGVQRDNVCCAIECGTCGGFKCNTFPGGAESCCTSRILDAGISCDDVDEGPCIIVEEPTHSPTMMPTVMPSMGSPTMMPTAMPSMGSPTMMLTSTPTTESLTIMPTVMPSMGSPTMMPTVTTSVGSPTMMPTVIPSMGTPTMMPTMSTCSNGYPGIQTDNVCCPIECGLCGGAGCSAAPGGSDSCCTARILTNGDLCADVNEAPCVIA